MYTMRHLRLLLSSLLALSLVACAGPPTAESPTAAPTAAATRTPRPSPPAEPTAPPTVNAPSVTPVATTAPTAPQPPLATLTAELSATVAASLPPLPGSDGSLGLQAQPLKVPEGWPPVWAVSAYSGNFTSSSQPHFVAVYRRDGDGWSEVDRVDLVNVGHFDSENVVQADIDPRYVWLEIQGVVGAHSGCYDLLRFDGQQLHSEASSCSSSTRGGWLHDINNDGVPEVVLDATDPYIFCFACGVRLVNYSVLRWDGQQMVEVELTPIPAEKHLGQLAQLTNQAIELAEHGLWKDAQAALDQTVFLAAYDETAAWDAAVIRLVAEARAKQAQSGIYPLLDNLFYGDYTAVLDVLRAVPPEQLFGADTPVVKGTVAKGYEPQLTYAITQSTGLALAIKPDLAAAHFLRGWAVQQADPGNPSILADIERAAELEPDEALFSESLVYLKR